MFKKFLAVATIVSVAACGGGGTTPGDIPMDPIDPTPPPGGLTTAASFQSVVDSATALDDAGSGSQTPSAVLQAQGSASYDGYIQFFGNSSRTNGNIPAATDIAGDLSLEIDFSSSDDILSGTVSDLVRRDGVTFAGDIALTNPDVSSSSDGGSISADLIGRVTDSNGERADFDTRLRAADAFGADAEQVRGSVGGEIDYLDEPVAVFGSFVTEK